MSKVVFIDGKKTKGFVSVNSAYSIPVSKRVSIREDVFVVGYFVGSDFKVIYECETIENARQLSFELQARTSYQVVLLSLQVKIARL